MDGGTHLTGFRSALTRALNNYAHKNKLPEPQFEEHPDEAKRIIDKCITAAKAREAARKARDLIIRRSTLDTATLADAAATAIGNLIRQPSYIPIGIEFAESIEGLKGLVIIIHDRMGLWGDVKTCGTS